MEDGEEDIIPDFCLFSSLLITHLMRRMEIAGEPCLAEPLSSALLLPGTVRVLCGVLWG